ncbi:MAG: hypothetical protein J6Q22_09400 [Prevotella sp.]|nr:hypothetical protein [Prevotella sp.]
MGKVMIYRDYYPSYYQYRKAIREYRDRGYIIRNVYGGVVCFEFITDYEVWKNQK